LALPKISRQIKKYTFPNQSHKRACKKIIYFYVFGWKRMMIQKTKIVDFVFFFRVQTGTWQTEKIMPLKCTCQTWGQVVVVADKVK